MTVSATAAIASLNSVRAVAGSNTGGERMPSCTCNSTPCAVSIIWRARGVGSMPDCVRTNSASPKRVRSRANAVLKPDWLMPSASAARVTLRVRSSVTSTHSKLRSKFVSIVFADTESPLAGIEGQAGCP